eukprot:359699-Chlamydomonas_euryale.AAC.1
MQPTCHTFSVAYRRASVVIARSPSPPALVPTCTPHAVPHLLELHTSAGHARGWRARQCCRAVPRIGGPGAGAGARAEAAPRRQRR